MSWVGYISESPTPDGKTDAWPAADDEIDNPVVDALRVDQFSISASKRGADVARRRAVSHFAPKLSGETQKAPSAHRK